MSSTEDNTNSSVNYRSIEKHEQQQALDLWYTVFPHAAKGFFERYFNAETSPLYQEGDTLGAWVNGKLVSAVHIRRLYIRSRDNNRDYLCGAIANVATLEEHRKHGYSRNILKMAITKMEQEHFDISVLGTGRPNHYSLLGWEQIALPSPINIEWTHFSSNGDHQWYSVDDIVPPNSQILLDAHSNKPRTYQFNRSPATMFKSWTGWIWKQNDSILYLLKDSQPSYVVISNVSNADIYVSEWRAPNNEIERKLFRLAANEIQRRQPDIKQIRFHTAPQYSTLEELEEWAGAVTFDKNDHTMIRNISLSSETLDSIKAAYSSGHATFWPGDYF